jgi:xanthine dehydrogenase YagS FAD-binding subunit
MKYFQHYSAVSVDEALSLLKQFNGRAKLIAGGTDLIGTLKSDILPEYPEAVIDIKTIPELDFIKEDDGGLTIGAMTKLVDIVQSPLINKTRGILADAAESVASPEIRNMGTLAGNLCQDTRCWYYRFPHAMGGRIQCFRKGKGPCPAVTGDNRYHAVFEGKKCFAVCPSDMAIALASLDSSITVIGNSGKKVIPIMDFYETLGSVLKPDEMVTEIQVPRPLDHTLQTFIKFRVRESVDFSIASVASAITVTEGVCRDARIILGAVAPTPYRALEAEKALIGNPLDSSAGKTAAASAVIHAKPLSRNEFKVEIIKALVERAINEATSRHHHRH